LAHLYDCAAVVVVAIRQIQLDCLKKKANQWVKGHQHFILSVNF
jgi:hypothetical protein